ncbi:basic amino acid/polyamine antiporter [Gordonibacter massiliensis (ex Traore et al. 2017)]|uniref:basic amino acid/polyamine antiporter n=1 Tax=Gordonibacter massiliensis (ex Traore et al. 2017) TaxID=1841863 RepID=UPI001EC5FD97|nr:basic amino acid/polyamine antiporter [Gordonibacter massiliensis (ex Traore et al. 2017)]MBX9033420.1 amino acid permease [Gordonibacter massiliensis (ex Traore et al. 2017)]
MSRAVSKSADKGMIIDPNGLSLFRLTMMVITASICGGIFALAGDMAAGGANTGAVLVSWAICFVGVFSLMMCFNGLSQARPDLTGGIYAYAAAGFTKYVGFNSAWGYWISACLSNVSFAILLFSALGYFFHPFESGNNLLSCVCASIFLWVLVVLVARGVKEAAGINVVVTIAKLVPLALFVLSIALLGKFDPSIFMENFWGEAGGPDFMTQVVSTMIALVWVFTGIEGAVVISGRAKYARDVGRATVIGFAAVFVLYLIISIESMGIMPRAQMAALATPSMAGILEHAIGPVGAGIVNLGVVLSLLGAMLGYVIIAAETPFEAARQGVFPKAFARTNKNGAPIVTVLISAGITQLFLIVSVFSSSTYQFFYACAVSTILIPYVCSAAYYMKIAWKRESLQPDQAVKARVLGTVGFVYTVFLVWAAGIVGIMITTILFAPGIIVYVVGQKGRGEPILPHVADKIIAAVIVAVMILSIALMATGTISVF